MTIWFAHCFVPGPGYGLVCPVLSSRARACRRDHQAPSAPLPDLGVTLIRETFPPPAETLLSGHRSYEHMCQSRVTLLCFGSSPRSRSLCRLLPAPAAGGTIPTIGIERRRASRRWRVSILALSVCKVGSQFHHSHVSRGPPIIPDGRVSQVRFEVLACRQ